MNLTQVAKRERLCVAKSWSNSMLTHLTTEQVTTLVNSIAVFARRKTVKHIAVVHYKDLPLYLVITRNEVPDLLHAIRQTAEQTEQYELCAHLNKLQTEWL
jgi:hypothetical protein